MMMSPGLGSSSVASAARFDVLAQHWWLLRWRGVAAIAFGLVVFHWPHLTLLTLTFLWAAYSLVDGALVLWGALMGKTGLPRMWLVLIGLGGIVSGSVAIAVPETVAGLLVFFVAAWAIATGLMQIGSAVQLRKAVDGEWILILDGAMAILFGVFLIV
jgi:uncharacterized membrane protein HdeD (DUF308 family)